MDEFDDNDVPVRMNAEWSHKIDEADIADVPVMMEIEADEEARALLAKRFGIIAVDSLKAKMMLSRVQGGLVVHIQGEMDADLTQECVVTTEPIPTKVQESFEGWFSNPEAAVSLARVKKERMTKKGHGEIPMAEEADEPEEIVDGQIDLGEFVAQHLSLSINPYPHAEGVYYELGDDRPEAQGSDLRKNPFAALKDWKDKINSGEH